MLTVDEVLKLLRISRTTLYTLRKEKVIPSYKVGKQGIRFKREDIEQYLEKQKQ